jgi:hypothetical protein
VVQHDLGHLRDPLANDPLFLLHERAATEAQASEFWERTASLVAELDRLPRAGQTVYGYAVGVYPTDHPTLPGSVE